MGTQPISDWRDRIITIFERIKNKANQALQSVGNFIDRDKTIDGVQLAPSGLGNRIRNNLNFSQYANNFQESLPSYLNEVKETIPTNPVRQENFNQSVRDVLGERSAPSTLSQGFNNWFAAPLLQVPYNVEEAIAGQDKSFLSRVGHGAQAGFGLLPGVDDALFAGYNAAKGASTQRDVAGVQPGLAGNEFFGLGDAVTGGADNTLSTVLNTVELPLLLMGGLKAKNLDEVLQNQTKRLDDLGFMKRVDGADDLVQRLPRRPADTIYVDPSGTAIKPKKAPKTTASLDRILQQADEVLPGGRQVDETIGGLLGTGDDVLALPAKVEGVTNTQKQGDSFFQALKKSKDVGTVDKLRLSRQQRLEKALPRQVYEQIKSTIVNPKNKLIAESVEWGKQYEDTLANLPIKIGSNEDKLIRQLNAGTVTVDDLVGEVGADKAAQIVGAHNQLRSMYDEMFKFINERRVAAGMSELPYKQDFLSQIGNRRSGNMVEDLFFTKDKTTGIFSEGIFKQQGEVAQDYGAIEGMMSYLDYAKRAGFTDLITPKLDEYIELARKAGADPSVVNYLDDYRNEILGIRDSGFLDKAAAITGEVRGAAVLGNTRSLISQSYNLPQAISNANPINFTKALFSKTARQAENQSPYLKTLSDNPPKELVKGYAKFKRPAVDAIQAANNVTARQIWRSFYEQGKNSGVDDVVQYADDLTVELMGDRRIGELGALHQSALGKILSPFTVEPQAAMNKFIKNIGEKKFATTLGTLVAWRVSNDLIQNFGTGDRPFLDPAAMFNGIYEQWYGNEEKEPDKVKAVARAFTEVSKLFPVLQSPVFTGVKLALGDQTRDIFGTEDPTWMNALSLYDITDVGRNVTGNDFIDVPLNLASKVTPYTNQIARTAQAAISQGRGYTESRNGNAMFETPDNPFDQGRALLFGQNSTQEARDMFNNEFDWGLNSKQSETIQQIPDREGRQEFLRNARQENVSDKRLESILDAGRVSDAGASDIESLFGGQSAKSSSIKERMDAYKELNKILTDDTLPQTYKDAAIKASGADPVEAQYYTNAAQDVDVKLQDVILPKLDSMADGEDVMEYLASQRRVVGGKQMLTSTMIDYLYERDYISNGQKRALKALRYDEIKDEFYYKKSYSGGGGGSGRLTYNQALKLFKVDLPKPPRLKSLDFLASTVSNDTSQTIREGERLLVDILNS